MSVQMMGAVINGGPQDRTQFCVMITLANYADDFGFAYPSIETIAANSRCDVRTVRRQIMDLEASGWIYCARKVVNGKSNAYILNIGRMGVRVPSDARRSPLFSKLCKRYGDTMTPIFAPEVSEDKTAGSEVILDTVRGQGDQSQRTKEGGSEDIACPPNRYNRHSLNHQGTVIAEPIPPTPQGGCEIEPADLERWNDLHVLLKAELSALPSRSRSFSTLRPDENDYDACFRGWKLVRALRVPDGIVLVTRAIDLTAAGYGMDKYSSRLVTIAKKYFALGRDAVVVFRLDTSPP